MQPSPLIKAIRRHARIAAITRVNPAPVRASGLDNYPLDAPGETPAAQPELVKAFLIPSPVPVQERASGMNIAASLPERASTNPPASSAETQATKGMPAAPVQAQQPTNQVAGSTPAPEKTGGEDPIWRRLQTIFNRHQESNEQPMEATTPDELPTSTELPTKLEAHGEPSSETTEMSHGEPTAQQAAITPRPTEAPTQPSAMANTIQKKPAQPATVSPITDHPTATRNRPASPQTAAAENLPSPTGRGEQEETMGHEPVSTHDQIAKNLETENKTAPHPNSPNVQNRQSLIQKDETKPSPDFSSQTLKDQALLEQGAKTPDTQTQVHRRASSIQAPQDAQLGTAPLAEEAVQPEPMPNIERHPAPLQAVWPVQEQSGRAGSVASPKVAATQNIASQSAPTAVSESGAALLQPPEPERMPQGSETMQKISISPGRDPTRRNQ